MPRKTTMPRPGRAASSKAAPADAATPRVRKAKAAGPQEIDQIIPAPTRRGRKGAGAAAPAVKAAPSTPADAEAPPRRRGKAVANAAAAAYGRTLGADAGSGLWSEAEIVEAFSRFEARDPYPKGELEHADPFTLLVAVVLSAQATDVGVNRATRGLFAEASTPAAMVALGEEGVARHIRTLGLFRGKAKNVVALSQLLLDRHGGAVPRDRAALEALPGVGRKTANVVLNIAFGLPTIAVDTHIFRVANRTGLAPGPTPLAVEEGLEARIPERFKLHAHHWLILHGRYICQARVPQCGRCLIADLCRWPDKRF